MGKAEKLIEIAGRQRDLLAELEREVRTFDEPALAKEKKRLETELGRLSAELLELKRKQSVLREENERLKNRLYDQTYNEKVTILNNTTEKMNIYFHSGMAGEENALKRLEASVRARTEELKTLLENERIESQDDICKKLEEAAALLEERRVKLWHKQQTGPFSPDEQEKLLHLKQERITDEQMNQLAKKNNIESLVGLSILNKLGIFLILIGIIAASRYTYVRLPDLLRGIMMFILGGGMLMSGELMNRKKANVFSLGITAGGVAALYIALSVSYFGLEIVTMYAALILCVLITATAFLLSTRYNSQTILSFALIGGYLPIFSIGGSTIVLYAAVVYFVALNLLALLISFERKWPMAAFIGLFLNMGGTICLCVFFIIGNSPLDKVLSIGYVIFAFLVYTLIPILGTYREKKRFKIQDIVLIAINTLFSSMMMYLLFFVFGLGDYDGVLTIFFSLIYLLMGRLTQTKFVKEKNMTGLFYLTGFVFAVLTIPLQLGITWLSMGWLIEGTALLIYGILNREKVFKLAGLIISGLCVVSFLIVDGFGVGIPLFTEYFSYKYFAITFGSIAVLGALIYKDEVNTRPESLYKNVVIVHFWMYMQFVIHDLLSNYLAQHMAGSVFNRSFLTQALSVICSLLLAYSIKRVKLLADVGVEVISIVFYVEGLFSSLALNTNHTLISGDITATIGTFLIGAVLLLLIFLISMAALNDLVRHFVVKERLSIAFYPLVLSAYFVVALTQILIFQYHLSFSSAVISIIYVITAFTFIVLGFMRRYSFLRRFGLGLAILAVVKLFLVDLYSLTQGYKIVSYFVLGVLLLAISFVYQYFSKRLDVKKEDAGDV